MFKPSTFGIFQLKFWDTFQLDHFYQILVQLFEVPLNFWTRQSQGIHSSVCSQSPENLSGCYQGATHLQTGCSLSNLGQIGIFETMNCILSEPPAISKVRPKSPRPQLSGLLACSGWHTWATPASAATVASDGLFGSRAGRSDYLFKKVSIHVHSRGLASVFHLSWLKGH